jgi:hypothetical protein
MESVAPVLMRSLMWWLDPVEETLKPVATGLADVIAKRRRAR